MDRGSPHGPRSVGVAAVVLGALITAGCATPAVPAAPSSAARRSAASDAVVPLVLNPHRPPGFSAAPAAQLPLGSRYFNPASGREEVVLGSLSRTAVIIGDSQAQPTDSWVRLGLEKAGYSVYVAGRGGTGFSVGTPTTHDYVDALRLGEWILPYGSPALVVIQGGGNDASQNSPDAAIANGATSLLAELHKSYPSARTLMIGTLAKSAADGGGRRTAVDALLGRTAGQLGVPFIGCGDWISRYQLANFLADGVHLTSNGREQLAPVLAEAVAARGLALG